MRDKRQVIIDATSDMMACFFYYDRKEDEELPIGALEEAILDGVITVDELVEKVRKGLEKSVAGVEAGRLIGRA